jgi:hypothetical protein
MLAVWCLWVTGGDRELDGGSGAANMAPTAASS